MCIFGQRRGGRLVGVVTLALLLGLLVAVSCEKKREPVAEREPPMPETASSELEMPEPVITDDIEGEASLPEGAPRGFSADLEGNLVLGNWDVRGEVTEFEDGKITFLCDGGQTGHFVYRLPEGLCISVHPNRPISLRRPVHFYRGGMGYNLVVSSGNALVLAAGEMGGSSPEKIRIWKNLTIEQAQDRGAVIDDNKYGTTYLIPVLLKSEHQTLRHITAEIDSVVQVTVGTQRYSVLVSRSCETVPSETTYGAVLEDAGFGLEYIVVPEQSP
jgi:hypothetical protein